MAIELSAKQAAVWMRDIQGKIRIGDQAIIAKYGIKLRCLNCEKDFYRIKWKGSARKKYCSRSCYRNHVRTVPEAAANWRGGTTSANGYKYIYLRGRSRAHTPEHIIVAEKALGRRLKARRGSGEVVHHINGNKRDNRNCNLLICTQSYHRWLHNRMSQLYAEEKFANLG
jgi:hypothetical protein